MAVVVRFGLCAYVLAYWVLRPSNRHLCAPSIRVIGCEVFLPFRLRLPRGVMGVLFLRRQQALRLGV